MENGKCDAADLSAQQADKSAVVMFDISDEDKKLVLHAAYYAVKIHDWRDFVFKAAMSKEAKRDLIGRFPGGDPMNNLLNIAERVFPDFDGAAPISREIERIEKFVYNT